LLHGVKETAVESRTVEKGINAVARIATHRAESRFRLTPEEAKEIEERNEQIRKQISQLQDRSDSDES